MLHLDEMFNSDDGLPETSSGESRYRRLPFRIEVQNHFVSGECFMPDRQDPPTHEPNTPTDSWDPLMRMRTYSNGFPHLRSENAPLCVVLVHQYSLMGGRSDNMHGIALNLTTSYKIPSVIFDMRGVGKSTGMPTVFGSSEVHDVVAVCEWAVHTLNCKNIILLGSSAGAPIAGSAIDKLHEIKGYVGIGYTFGFLTSLLFGHHNKTIMNSPKPKLFVHGDQDGFTSMSKFNSTFLRMSSPKEKINIPNVGHFEMEAPHYDAFMAKRTYLFIKKYFGDILSLNAALMNLKCL